MEKNIKIFLGLNYFRVCKVLQPEMNPCDVRPGTETLPERIFWLRYAAFLFKNRFIHNAEEHRFFPYMIIPKSEKILPVCAGDAYLPHFIEYHHAGKPSKAPVDMLMEKTETTAFLIIKDGKILAERYYNGYCRESYFRTYSVTKSFISVLTGIANREGLLPSLDEPVSYYLPELHWSGEGQRITLRHLLAMNQGIRFTEGYLPWKDNLRLYLHQNTRKIVLNSKIDTVSDKFHYNDFSPVLVSLILEKVTGKPLALQLAEKIWWPMGAEFDAALTCDSRKNMLGKGESGLNMRAIDLARFGLLCLNKGQLHNIQIVPSQWMEESTRPDLTPGRYDLYKDRSWGRMFFNKPGNGYGYYWWASEIPGHAPDFFAFGIMGQILYISPRLNAVALRLGRGWNLRDWWPDVLRSYLERIR